MSNEIATTNQVRQILFNELGLTREYIRETVKEITEATVEKFFRSGEFDKYLRNQIDAQLRTYRYGSGELVTKITEIITAEIKKNIMASLQVKVEAEVFTGPKPKNCDACDGSGKFFDGWKEYECHACGGTGHENEPTT